MEQPSGVHISANLPLQWQSRDTFSAEELADWMHGNVVVLQALDRLESVGKEGDPEHRVDHHVARLEAKLDLTLTLVGELLRRQTPLPPSVAVVLGSETLAWQAHGDAPHGTGVVALYLSPRLPWPLTLPVEIIGAHAGTVRAKLTHLSEEAQDWLDRTLFRHHRREVHARTR